MNQQCIVEYVNSVPELFENWGLFYEGWQALRRPDGARATTSCPGFLRRMLKVVSLPRSEGTVIILKSKNKKPLGFSVVFNDSEDIEKRTAIVASTYLNGKYIDAAREMMYVVEMWAIRNGYSELHAQTARMNGAGQRFFERKLGFQPACIMYKKIL